MAEPLLRAVEEDWPDTFGVQHVTVHGYRRAFVKAGSGPALLLLHGVGDSSATWAPLVPLLAERFTVIAPDLLGHGASDRPRADYSVPAFACGMRDLLAVLGIESATVVGHSLGGGIAMQMSYQFPQVVERLVLVAPGGAGREIHPLLRLAAVPGAPVWLPMINNRVSRTYARFWIRTLSRVSPSVAMDADEFFTTMAAIGDGATRSAFCRTLRSVSDLGGQSVTMLDRCYMSETIPTLLMWGARDHVLPVAHAHSAVDAMPKARLHVFADSGHFPHHSDPVAFLQVLQRFIDDTEPAQHDEAAWRDRLRRG